ncbi:hypothetical protein [Haloarcula sp. Atlit-7R]|uniref:hypothetical protein n=1 Tax=Haloarcula sp. Atlit-7R TaxID=2282125 RepID=UPI000EF1581D|nr:hypothetical protein [Haloarcula sp. Atlit-7R]RLM94397.1 hypothetical protein D3D01_16165 [Haloarcula sp. Atlit-7R]
MNSDTEHTWTVISYNRPLTRQSRRALSDCEILEIRHPRELNRWSEVDVDERPAEELLKEHELRLEDPTGGEEPNVVYDSPDGTRVEVYDELVYTNGSKSSISPEKAQDVAERNGWEKVSGQE